MYRDINIQKLEEAAPGSREFPAYYRDKAVLRLNSILPECLTDESHEYSLRKAGKSCAVWGKTGTDLIQQEDEVFNVC